MNRENEKNIDYLILNENEKFPSLRFMNILDIFPCVLILNSAYLLINGIVTLIPNSVISSGIGLLTYIIMLYIAQKWIGKIKSNMQMDFKLENREISACFLLILLINGICLMALAYINRESLYCVMGIISLTLYVGFAVSLEKLFDDGECSIKYQLLKPFFDVGFNVHPYKFFLISLVAIFFIVYEYIIVILVLIVSLVFIAIVEYGKRRINNFFERIVNDFSSKKILVLQLGAENAAFKIVKKKLSECSEIVSGDEVNGNIYDMIIVLNTLRNERYKIVEKYLNKVSLCKDGIVIDPFFCGIYNLRFWSSWLGVPVSLRKKNTIKTYVDLIK